MKIKVTYDDGTDETFTNDNGVWKNDATGQEGLPDDITLMWDNTGYPVTDDSQLRHDGDNTITVGTTANPDITDRTEPVDVSKKPVTIVAAGTPTKVYDGTTALPENLGITYTVVGLEEGDTLTATADAQYVDKDVTKFGDTYPKAVVFTNPQLAGDADTLNNYELVNATDDEAIQSILGSITPRELLVDIVAPQKTRSSSKTADLSVNPTKVKYSEAKGSNTYSLADGSPAIVDGDTVTITYSGQYASIATATTNATVTVNAGTLAVDGSDNTTIDNYTVKLNNITGTVKSSGGGGGGGGTSTTTNKLTIHYENEDGTAGDDATTISVPLGTDPTDLIGVIQTEIKDMTVLWESDNEEVATVDENGLVTFVGEGKATITATSKQTKTLTDSVVVTVTAAPEPTETPEPSEATPKPTTKPSKEYEKTDSLITKDMLNPYIVGYEDYVFGPELPISREELSAIFARLIANNLYMDKDYDTSFPDVPEKWSKSYIGYLEGFNVVTGYEDGTFRPENYITRAEMAVMMAKAEGYDLSGYVSPDELDYADVDEGYSTWAATKAIQILTDEGIMQGYPDGTFRPGQPITRAETVATVNRVLSAQEVADFDVLPSDVTDAHWAYNDIVFAMNHRILKDVSADPNAFIWSEQFDENMITVTEKVEGEVTEVTGSSEEQSSGETEADDSGTTE